MPLRRTALCSLLALSLIPAAAQAAEEISYSFLEIDYIAQDIDGNGEGNVFDNFVEDFEDGDGYGFKGSISLGSNFFIFGNYARTDSEYTFIADDGLLIPDDQDVITLRLGGGFHVPMSTSTDLVVRGAYMDVDFGDYNLGATENSDINSDDDLEDAIRDLNDDSSDGYFADVGIRSQITDWLELGGGARYTDLDTGDDLAIFGNALVETGGNFGISIGADFYDDLTTYAIGLRYSF
ncbi:MAG: outer membrane beta-barrel protein [Gammaproteobacteria bacterium]